MKNEYDFNEKIIEVVVLFRGTQTTIYATQNTHINMVCRHLNNSDQNQSQNNAEFQKVNSNWCKDDHSPSNTTEWYQQQLYTAMPTKIHIGGCIGHVSAIAELRFYRKIAIHITVFQYICRVKFVANFDKRCVATNIFQPSFRHSTKYQEIYFGQFYFHFKWNERNQNSLWSTSQ